MKRLLLCLLVALIIITLADFAAFAGNSVRIKELKQIITASQERIQRAQQVIQQQRDRIIGANSVIAELEAQDKIAETELVRQIEEAKKASELEKKAIDETVEPTEFQ